jgi:hypothetical protein
MKIAAPQTIDAYLAALPPDQRAALEKLRQQVLAIAPTAEECLSYGQPAFRLHGRLLVALGADGEHCTLHPLSASWIKVHHDDLKGYPTSKGVIRFRADKPLPVALVRKLVKERVAQNAAKEAAAATALRLAAKRAPLVEAPQSVEATPPEGGSLRPMPTHHRVDFFEIPALDLAASKAFYAAAFGFTFVDYGPDYADVQGAGLSGGLRKVDAAPPRGGTMIILYSDDLGASERAVTAAGAAVLERHEFPGGRRFHFLDPAGNELAIWTKA